MLKYAFLGLLLLGCSKSPESPQQNQVNSLQIQAQGDGNFGQVSYGDIKSKSFVFTNNEEQVLSLNPQVSSTDFLLGLTLGCSQVEPGKSCLVKILFNSQGKLAGTYNSELLLGTLSFPLSATIASVPEVQYDFYLNRQKINSSHDLGSLVTGQVSIYNLKIVNNSPMMGDSSSLTSSSSFYSLIYNNCQNISLKPSESCQAKLYIKGDNVSEIKNTNLIFGSAQVGLNLQNQAQEATVLFEASSPEVEIGDFYNSGEKIIKALILTNTGTGAGSVENIVLPSEYSIAHNSCLGVKPGNKCIIRLTYSNPNQSKGQYTDSISLGETSLDLIVNQVNKPSDLGTIEINSLDNILTNQCSPFEIVMKDIEGLPYVISSDNIFVSSHQLYSDSNCSEVAESKLSSFESSKTFYIKNNTAGLNNVIINKAEVEKNKSIYFYDPLSVSPLQVTVTISDPQMLSPIGGKPPYSFMKISGVGEVSPLGIYSSLDTGVAELKLVDSLGQEVLIPTTVSSNISVSLGDCTYSNIAEGVSCSLSVTGGVGDKTWTTSNGSIDSETGAFYGICSNNNGESEVTATDSRGNTGSINVTYPCVYKTCSELRAKALGTISGDYWIDPDGLFRSGTTNPTKVYCDFRPTATYAFMAEKKSSDGFYFPLASAHNGQIFGFYNYGPSANGTFSKDLRVFSPIAEGVIMLEDLSTGYNYKMTWNGIFAAGNFKALSSSALNTKIYTLHSSLSAPSAGTNLGFATNYALNNTEDACGMGERNGSNPLGSPPFSLIALTVNNWGSNGSQNLCPYGLGAHGDYNYDGYNWLGANKTAAGTSVKIYYQDIYYHHAKSCLDAKNRSIVNQAGNLNSGYWTIDPDGYLNGVAPFTVYCNQTASSGGWTLVAYNTGNSGLANMPTSFFVSEINKTNMSNISLSNRSSSLNVEYMSSLLKSNDVMLISSPYSASPIVETGIGQWNYNTTKCSGTLRHTSRTAGCPGQNANDDFSGADRFNIGISNGQVGIVPGWLNAGNELCYSGAGWCSFYFYIR